MKTDKKMISWALYDFGNSAFATTVMAAFFPIFFKTYWGHGLEVTQSTFYLGATMTVASLIFAAMAPFLGILGDRYSLTKIALTFFILIGGLSCIGFYFVDKGNWLAALIIYCISWIGFSGGNLFYDSLLVSVAKEDERDWVSCLGYSFGYIGGGLLVVLNAAMVMKPELFGFADKAIAFKYSFASVGVWWLIFSIPILLYVDNPDKKLNKQHSIIETLKKVANQKSLVIFLAAYFFYIDGVHTVFKMAVDFALSIGLKPPDLIIAIIIVQFVGFPMAFITGYLANKWGNRTCINIGIIVYAVICLVCPFVTKASEFYILAAIIASVQGGVQALSRSFFSQYVPKENASEYFGFFNMFGKFSAIMGPILVGLMGIMTNNPRYSLLIIFVLFLVGGLIFRKVPQDA